MLPAVGRGGQGPRPAHLVWPRYAVSEGLGRRLYSWNVLLSISNPLYLFRAHHAAYFCRSLSKKRLLSAVTSQALGQKHRSTHHQSLGTPQFMSSGTSLSKFSLPVPKGLWVLVLCSLRVPSESMRWIWVILPLSFLRSSMSPPGRVSRSPIWLAPTTAHM